jgi:hypothetical protein
VIKVKGIIFKNNLNGLKVESNKVNSLNENLVFISNTIGAKYNQPFDSCFQKKSFYFNNELGCILQGFSKGIFKNNLLSNNLIGLRSFGEFNGVVRNCNFYNNRHGMILSGDYELGQTSLFVTKNIFRNNLNSSISIQVYYSYISARPIARYNNIFDATPFTIYGTRSGRNIYDLDFGNNWLNGELDSLKIEEAIHDKDDVTEDDKPYVGQILFMPIESLENESCGLLE